MVTLCSLIVDGMGTSHDAVVGGAGAGLLVLVP